MQTSCNSSYTTEIWVSSSYNFQADYVETVIYCWQRTVSWQECVTRTKTKKRKKNSPKSMANKPKTLRHLTPQVADHQCQHCTHWQNWFQSLFNGFPCSHLCCCSISPWLNKLRCALKCKFIHIFLQLLWFHWVYVPDHTFSKFLIFQQPGVVFTCLDGELPSSSSSTLCHCDVSC